MIDILQWVLSFILFFGAAFGPPITLLVVLSGFANMFCRGKRREESPTSQSILHDPKYFIQRD